MKVNNNYFPVLFQYLYMFMCWFVFYHSPKVQTKYIFHIVQYWDSPKLSLIFLQPHFIFIRQKKSDLWNTKGEICEIVHRWVWRAPPVNPKHQYFDSLGMRLNQLFLESLLASLNAVWTKAVVHERFHTTHLFISLPGGTRLVPLLCLYVK